MATEFTQDDHLLIAGVLPHFSTSIEDFISVFTHRKGVNISRTEILQHMQIALWKMKETTFPAFQLLDPDITPKNTWERGQRMQKIRKHKGRFVRYLLSALREQLAALEDEMLELRHSAVEIDSGAFLRDNRPTCRLCRRDMTGQLGERMPGAYFCDECFGLETCSYGLQKIKEQRKALERRIGELEHGWLEPRKFDDGASIFF
ncbi:MAG: hypothetical protein Q9183_003466 [Haloplaca sp. 2 TL-2023]